MRLILFVDNYECCFVIMEVCYARQMVHGARGRTRTCDLPVISRVLQPTKLPAQRQVGDRPSHHKDDGTLILR